jgi:hypothetical protein
MMQNVERQNGLVGIGKEGYVKVEVLYAETQDRQYPTPFRIETNALDSTIHASLLGRIGRRTGFHLIARSDVSYRTRVEWTTSPVVGRRLDSPWASDKKDPEGIEPPGSA